MSRSSFLLSLALATLMTLSPFTMTAEAADKPNVLIIITDDMGYADLSFTGSKQVKTPNIDRIAHEGVYFEQAYVNGVVCGPSRSGLIAGRYQHRFGAEHNWNEFGEIYNEEYIGINPGVKVMSQYIKENGYATAMIGKWHVGETDRMRPEARGFDYAFWMGGNHTYWPKADRNGLKLNGGPVTEIEVPYLTDWWTKSAIDWMSADHKGMPWFIYLGYNTPHTPMHAKEEDLAKYKHIKNNKRRTYLAMQDCLDQNIGKIFKTLEETGQLDNTLIIFTNDNGGPTGSNGSLNAPFRGEKSCFLEGGMRVPMMFYWQGKITPGSRFEHPVTLLDLLPTVLAAVESTDDLVSYDANEAHPAKKEKQLSFDGVNLFPYIQGARPADERPHETLYFRAVFRGAAIRDGDWKLITTRHDLPFLYNIADDPQEMNNLLLELPEKAAELKRKLGTWEGNLEGTPTFFNSNRWLRGKYKQYEKDYVLEQPDP